MRRLLFLVTAALVAALTITFLPGTAQESSDGDVHCVASVIGQADSGEFLLSEPDCVTGDESALAALWSDHGLVAPGTSGDAVAAVLAGTSSDRVIELAAASSILGTHYDGVYSGSSFTVTGSNCNGGWINLSGFWNNRVSSTVNGLCHRIKHHDYANKGGSYQSTWGWGGSLTYMNNRASSISYNNS